MSTVTHLRRNVSDETPVPDGFTPEHLAWLAEKCAVGQDVIEATGAYSATEPEHLPTSLRYRQDELPGIVFALNRVDGSTVWQFRPDRPADPEKKYGQEPGSGSVVCLHPWMVERLDAAMDEHANGGPKPHLIAVEGTKQLLTFVENAPETIAVKVGHESVEAPVVAFGIQGCRNWSSEGAPTHEMTELLGKAQTLTILFDGDRLTNPAVYDAGKDLAEFARLRGADLVRFGSVAGGGAKADLDGTLSRVPAGERGDFLARLLDDASDKIGRRPAGKKAAQRRGKPDKVGRVDWDAGVTYEPDTITTSGGVTARMPSDEVLARFAARIVRTVMATDDLNPGASASIAHDLEVRLEGHERTYLVSDVPDSGLREIRSWLNEVGRGRGTLAIFDNTDNGQRRIENTIRYFQTDLIEPVPAYRRTGWVKDTDDVWLYLTPTGAIGPDGVAEEVFCRLDNTTYQASICIPDPAKHDGATHRSALREYLLIGEQRLHDPLTWYATVGAMAYASTGAAPRGGLLIAGKHGSGKTVITQTAATAYGPAFHAEGGALMGSMNGTANAVGSIGQGLHHMLVVVDDIRRRSSQRRQDEQDTAVEDLIRRTYEGGSAGRARMRVDRKGDGRIKTDAPDAACPMVAFTAEYVPSATSAGSSLERLLSITVTAAETMKPGETASMAAIGKSGRPAIAWAGFLRWQAQQIEEHGGLEAWTEFWTAHRDEVVMAEMADFARERGVKLSSRAAAVASAPLAGWHVLLEYAEEIGAISEDEQEWLAQDIENRLTAAAIRHTTVEMADSETPASRLISQIRALTFRSPESPNGAYLLGGDNEVISTADRRALIGVHAKKDLAPANDPTGASVATDVVALNPDAVAMALTGNGSRVTVDDLRITLKDVAVRNAKGKFGWQQTIGAYGKITNALVLRLRDWAPEGDAKDDEAPAGERAERLPRSASLSDLNPPGPVVSTSTAPDPALRVDAPIAPVVALAAPVVPVPRAEAVGAEGLFVPPVYDPDGDGF